MVRASVPGRREGEDEPAAVPGSREEDGGGRDHDEGEHAYWEEQAGEYVEEDHHHVGVRAGASHEEQEGNAQVKEGAGPGEGKVDPAGF